MEAIKTIVNKVSVPSEKKTKQKEYLPKGVLPVIDQGQMLIGGYTDDTSKAIECDLPIIVFGDHTCFVKYIDFPFGAGADGIKVIKPKEGILPKYLYYGIQYLVFRLSNRGYGRHYQHIEKMSLNVPSISQQERIISQIEESLSQLDSAVETLKKTKQQLEVYRQAVLKEAFNGNLTQHWRKNNDCQEWSSVSILKLIKKDKNALKAGPFGSALKKSCYVPNGYKVYGQEQVIAGDETIGDYYVDESKYKELFNCRVQPHDILISLVGTVGKVLILSDTCKEGIINPRLIKVSLNESIMIPKFFLFFFWLIKR